jgi:hypothetical protein
MPIHGRHGIYDLSSLHFSQHARQRFAERVAGTDDPLALIEPWTDSLKSCRKLGTNSEGDEAFLGLYQAEPFVLIAKNARIVTVMTLQQFESVMIDFGRSHWPRRFGRWLRKLDRADEARLPNDKPPSDEPPESS